MIFQSDNMTSLVCHVTVLWSLLTPSVDYGLILKHFWLHKATHHAEQFNLLGETQWGAIPMCSVENVNIIYEYITEISRMTYTPLTKLQKNTVAYFDRQVNSRVMLNNRKYEVPDQAYTLLSATLHQIKYHVKTVLGVSDTSYDSTPKYPHYGLAQCCGCAGRTWLFESTPMMETVEKNAKVLTSHPLTILYHTQSRL